MCLIVFAWRAHPEFPLVVAANRDEFFDRPSAAAQWWDDGSQRLAGRDLQAGGTWMGISRNGRFAALTNYRDPSEKKPDAPSRGALIAEFLVDATEPADYLAALMSAAPRYSGFNLLAAQIGAGEERNAMRVMSNRDQGGPRIVSPGIHALSNALLDTPWPKVEHARAALRAVLAKSHRTSDELTASLLDVLADRATAPDNALPNTGLTIDRERALSSIFIRMPGYGTRASTVLIVDAGGRVTFTERRCEPGLIDEDRRFEFAIEPSPARPPWE